ncbi:hypothetical protein [Acidaminobacter hydrogenoformans]|uniref:Uncharacterized protein n=1 Tax=Acidaminobacter hydrogenoformans DSM 2784 TaxID=1120920 RepID=A0A1G5S2E3_9FIRM|nr:hypothetical protein [Acidaminobacter hydrogenoformans]SCZ79921.1 hypothetical protein SAMN03080599_02014 [Acidaminobacter hydrogenoformans DSM 2784]
MKKRIEDVVSAIFSIFILIAILGGGIVFLMFAAALIVGGEMGSSIAVSAKSVVMPYFIRAATIGTLAGLVSFYLTGLHALSIEKKSE